MKTEPTTKVDTASPLSLLIEHCQHVVNTTKPSFDDLTLTEKTVVTQDYYVDKIIKEYENKFMFTVSHPDITSLVVCRLGILSNGITKNCYLLQFKNKSGQKSPYFFVPHTDAQLVDNVINQLPHQNVELRTRKKVRHQCEVIESNYWENDTWEKKYVSGPCETIDTSYYETISDPLLLDQFTQSVLPLVATKEQFTIVDAGGGNGRLAMKLIDLMQQQSVALNYIFIEPTSFGCKEAQRKFNDYQQAHPKQTVTFTVMQTQLDTLVKEPVYAQMLGTVDCVISSGGPLNLGIVSENIAHQNLSIIEDLLAEGGILLATGLTSLFISKKQFTQNNFAVQNTCKILNNDLFNVKQMYVCTKQANNTPQLSQKPVNFNPNSHTLFAKPNTDYPQQQLLDEKIIKYFLPKKKDKLTPTQLNQKVKQIRNQLLFENQLDIKNIPSAVNFFIALKNENFHQLYDKWTGDNGCRFAFPIKGSSYVTFLGSKELRQYIQDKLDQSENNFATLRNMTLTPKF